MKKRHGLLVAIVVSLLATQGSAIAAPTVVVIPLYSHGDKVTTVRSRTGKIWMDRNLGAVRVAGSKSDSLAYGWLYQWGRPADGHESRESPKTADNATVNSNVPGHGSFIVVNIGIRDWRSPQNNDLWNGVSGTNNPCPPGFRVPTIDEWQEEAATWYPENADGAFESPLRLTTTGYRRPDDGLIIADSFGRYWSSDDTGGYSYLFLFHSSGYNSATSYRGSGFSVRCIKN